MQEHLLGCKWAHGDVAVLAGEISNLAGLWLGVITRRDLAADIRIKMSRSSRAIAIGGHWSVQISGSVSLQKAYNEVKRHASRLRGG